MQWRSMSIPMLCVAWTALLALSLVVGVTADYDNLTRQAEIAARVAFEKDVTYRSWNSRAGGVYTPIQGKYQPNPYLDVPDRDVTTLGGVAMTMINPAYMTRLVHEIQRESTGVLGHITSLNPIRPGNAPDAWEREALLGFEEGGDHTVSVADLGGLTYLRFMKPLVVEASCLKCHRKQGYEAGQIRGGISVAVPLEEHLHAFHLDIARALGIHGLIWMAGLMGIVLGGRRVQRSIRETREAGRRALEASRAKSEFLANMSHEIRTPLNGILGMLQVLESSNLDREQRGYVEIAASSSRRLTKLLSDILDLSRVEAGRMKIVREPFEPRRVLGEVEELFAQPARDAGIGFTVGCDAAVPERLVGDGQRLSQILLNLAGNAVKFTSKGEVAVEAFMLPGCRALFTVRDSGIGIPEDKLAELFEPFTQAEGSNTRAYQGAGLGLTIVRRLTKLMGGEICVCSEPGKGAAFYLSLPFERVRDGADGGEGARAEPQRRDSGLETALVVEDDRTSQLVLSHFLSAHGIAAEFAANGREAVEMVGKGRFDLVLMDVQMPVMDGIEATRAIRRGEAGRDKALVPIVAMTAHAMSGDREHFLSMGMDAYLAKPVDREKLARVLAQVLTGQQAHQI